MIPSICRICRQYHRNEHAICTACMALMEPLGPACRSCANPLTHSLPPVCGACSVRPPALDYVFTAYRYTEPLKTLVQAFKYDAALYLTSFLASLMLAAIEDDYPTQCLIPIPLYTARIRARGFNQSALLARYLSSSLQKPYDLQACIKRFATPTQASLPAKERQTNLLDAFEARALPYQHVTLIDDLFTTGATANEVARTLKTQAGVVRVDLWCCARAC